MEIGAAWQHDAKNRDIFPWIWGDGVQCSGKDVSADEIGLRSAWRSGTIPNLWLDHLVRRGGYNRGVDHLEDIFARLKS
jgi:hypothetical protein